MENNSTQKLSFHGTGAALFGIQFVNLLLTIVTLGFYYPWARAASLRYIYQETEFMESRFTFHGTGKEMFNGFIKLLVILGVLYGILALAVFSGNSTLVLVGTLVFYLGIFLIIPIIIHGSMRYKMSRTSWRSIHFGYRGNAKELMALYYKNLLLTIVTLGFYGAWMAIEIRKYIISNVRFGNVKFSYTGDGGEFFWLNLKGMFLSIITLYIYSFWYAKDLFNYYINHLKIEQEGRQIELKSTATGGGFFGLMFVNILIIVFTLGLGAPWATTRMINYILANISFDEGFNPDILLQTEENYTDALGEDMLDAFDIDLA